MKKILVAIDGSKYADIAIEKARVLAQAFGSDVVLITVNDFEQNFLYQGMNEKMDSNLVSESWEKTKEILQEAKNKFAGMPNKVETISLKGNIVKEIVGFANTNDVDVVIMGSHGRNSVQRFLIGSVTQKVAQQCNKTVIIAR